MGTIAEKLTYLNTTKTMLRDSLNKFGSSILSTDTFRSYDTKLNEIYDKLPKVTQSGAGFTLENVQNGLLDDFKMIGTDLEQETVETITVSDWEQGTIYDSNGYLEQSNDEVRTNDFIEIFPNTLYYISRTIYTSYMKFRFYDEQKNYVGSQATATVTTNKSENRMQINESSMELTINDSNIKYMKLIDHSNDLSTVYTITTNATPSPDYPQDIKVAEGRQVITDKGKNLFDKDNATKGYYYSSTAIEESANWYIYQAPVKANTNYYLSGNNYSNVYARIWLLDESKNRISTIGDYKNTHLITTTDNTAYIGLSIADYNGTADMDTLQLEENSSATDYEPYYNPVSYNIDLQLANIYLAKIPNTTYKNKIYKNNGNWYFEKNVEKVILDGSEDYYEYSINENIIRFQPIILNDLAVPLTQYMSNNFKYLGTISEATEMGIANGVSTTNSRCFIFILKSIASNTANFKTWLSTHNTEVWYILETPVTTQITNTTLINQLEAISVYTGTNIITISNSNNIIPEIEITRLKELEKLA